MAVDRDRKYLEMAARGKYQRLYTHLCGMTTQEWRPSFDEIESIIGFELPASTGRGGRTRPAETVTARP